MGTQNKGYIIEYREDGSFRSIAPYEEHMAVKFAEAVWRTSAQMRIFWNQEVTPEVKWRIAQAEYENFKEELPAKHLAYYLPHADT